MVKVAVHDASEGHHVQELDIDDCGYHAHEVCEHGGEFHTKVETQTAYDLKVRCDDLYVGPRFGVSRQDAVDL
jgi:hypothetical protein